MASTEITLQAAQNKVENLAERDADSTESEIRYLAYGARLRTALRAGTRLSEKPNMPYRAIRTEMDRSAYNAL